MSRPDDANVDLMAASATDADRFEQPLAPKLAILAVDGGGIRGLIPALVLERLEGILRETDPTATLASSFDLISGTSTGGLIAIGLATPTADGSPALDAAEMVGIYKGSEARQIFQRPPLRRLPALGPLSDLLDPKYGLDGLREVLAERFGEATIADALTGLLITSYDMHGRAPRFFKPWREESRSILALDAALATAAAPTYFPAHELGEEVLIDGGVFANNPTIAATIEAMKRVEGDPIHPEDLLVLSLGTGHHERGFDGDQVRGWGALGWVLPSHGEPPLIGAMLDGQSDSSDHWAHVLLNHDPGSKPDAPAQMGRGPRYYRFQPELPSAVPLDGIEPTQLAELERAASEMIAAREDELRAIAAVLSGRGAERRSAISQPECAAPQFPVAAELPLCPKGRSSGTPRVPGADTSSSDRIRTWWHLPTRECDRSAPRRGRHRQRWRLGVAWPSA